MNLHPITFYSGALNSRKTCYVLLPPSYNENVEKEYPVIYLLHGMNGAETDWIYKLNAVETIESMRIAGELRDSIVVIPSDGGYDRGTFYLDWYDGSGNFEQYFIHDLIPFIDSQYRTIKSEGSRMLGGYSMGGYGSFMLALRHSNLFGAAASLSGAFGPMASYQDYERARLLGPLYGPHAQKYDLFFLSEKQSKAAVRPKLYMNCGTEDFLYEANTAFEKHLSSIDYPVICKEFSGEHNGEYFKAHLADMLHFFEESFSD